MKRILRNNINIFRNIGYLSVLQVFLTVFPLITYPYLIRVLGVEKYGIIIFAQAIIGYFTLFVSFGFNLSATKQVSINRNNKEKLNEIVSSVLIIKGCFFLVSLIILYSLMFIITELRDNKLLFFFTMWMPLYDFLFPNWYFQGIEKMKFITLITLISRLIFLCLIFLIINKESDYIYVPIINGIGSITAGLISLYIVFVKNKIIFKFPVLHRLIFYFKDSLVVFMSNVSIKLYVSTNKVIIGAFLGMTEIAYFDLAEKITAILKTPIMMIGRALYPKISLGYNRTFIKNAFLLTILITTLIYLSGFIFSGFIIKILGGTSMFSAIIILKLLLLSLFPITVSLYFSNLNLLAQGLNRDYLKTRIYTFSIYFMFLLLLYLLDLITLNSITILIVLIEFITAIFSIYFSTKNNINFLICPKK